VEKKDAPIIKGCSICRKGNQRGRETLELRGKNQTERKPLSVLGGHQTDRKHTQTGQGRTEEDNRISENKFSSGPIVEQKYEEEKRGNPKNEGATNRIILERGKSRRENAGKKDPVNSEGGFKERPWST